ncbi:hypothetical protein IJ541_09775 [bacterium]|nr:hypothetical protein [bacterium]
MKKIAAILTILLSTNISYGAAYCPSPNEYRSKMEYFQYKALGMMAKPDISVSEADALWKEQENYMNSTFPNCIQYFQTMAAPDCEKLRVLATSYIMLDKGKKVTAKSQINSLNSHLSNKCPVDYKTLRFMIDD